MCRAKLSMDFETTRQNYCKTMSRINLYVIVKGALRFAFIFLNHVYYISYLIWIALLYPLKKCGFQEFFYKIEGQLQYGMMQVIASWSKAAGYEVLEAGDDITQCLKERTLLLVNHQSTGDVPMLFNAFITRTEILPNIMWIMDSFLKYSTFGIVCSIRRDFFIFQGKDTREKSLESLSKHLYEAYLPLKRNWLVLFPEGGFLYKRRANSQRYGAKHNLPHLEHVTIPRTGAFQVIMDGLHSKRNNNLVTEGKPGQHLKYVLDITIGYPKAVPVNALAVLFGHLPPCQTTVFYRLYPIEDIPQNPEGYSKWLLDRWEEKDKMLKIYYKTGKFPLESKSRKPAPVAQSVLHYVAVHLAFSLSVFLHYRIIMLVYQYCSG